jgi:hypothetical protein
MERTGRFHARVSKVRRRIPNFSRYRSPALHGIGEEEDPARADRADFDEWVAGLHRAKTIHYANMMTAGVM